METPLREGERLDDLARSGLKIIQSRSAYSFGLDSVLLAHFVRAGRGDLVVDLGAGNGVIAILLSALTPASRIVGIEIQPELAGMAKRSVSLNGLSDRVEIVEGNLLQAHSIVGRECVDVVVSNPPYMRDGSGAQNPNPSLAVARHEIACTLEDVVRVASVLLKNGGRLSVVHRTERLDDVVVAMRSLGVEPKRLLMVHPKPGAAPGLFLMEGIKCGRPGLSTMPPLYVYDENGGYSEAMRGIYG
ncbi:MAG: tRNA1(Val) (adenine(37)-N6)-methyltransferase [Ignavibacteriales bacterium]